MADFKREKRYYVLKLSDIQHLSRDDHAKLLSIGVKADQFRQQHGKQDLECVVVESDWPEYEIVWSLIEARETAKSEVQKLKSIFHRLRNETEKAAHAYAVACDVGPERLFAFEVYDRIRHVIRKFY
ncbi:hypothetical protein [Spartinivicinus marinus]|uniref:hypothetical protein n=1 Tax=Spartinivicinus marinus TaxID=2994442 RepID=UPI0022510107|nr:hypothetical protein [Spartinivicinus marinus]MCX4025133.1 hypothetical protein [Spartinivicinus marinus]